MGTCFSKKPTNITTNSSSACQPPDAPVQIKSNPEPEKKKAVEEPVKKEIFVIKHRKSHEIDRRSDEEEVTGEEKADPDKVVVANSSVTNGGLVATGVRTSSCTKEEVDAILIQCGRLSRSASTRKAAFSGSSGGGFCDNLQSSRKYSGSKRSYDFDNEVGDGDKKKGNGSEENSYDENGGLLVGGGGDEAHVERIHRHRQRQSRTAASSPHGRRRTPSREREQQQQQQQRSGSRERGNGGTGGGRRVSRSPGRRSESPITTSNGGGNGGASGSRPGKMVSVPATVSSLAVDKSTNGDPPSAAAVKRIQVKRNVGEPTVGGGRSAALPRSRSPARANAQSNQQQQPLSLSRSNSRKAEQSPYRRNPLSEIDTNVVGFEQSTLPGHKATNISPLHQKPNAENLSTNKLVAQGIENKNSSIKGTLDNNAATVNLRAKEQQQQQQQMVAEAKAVQPAISNVAVTMIPSAVESLKPQTLTRSRSSRRSRDLDINPESLLNPDPSYTALLLEDIQNFHQKNAPSFSLPDCLTKANSILEAVADLNSSTSSNLSFAFSDDRRRNPATEQFNKNDENSSSAPNPSVKKRVDAKDPILESQVNIGDDLMQPSFHKYVTVRRGPMGGEDMEEQESSGSNSFVGGQQYWLSSSTWEPNSADSTDGWTSSRSTNTKEDDFNPFGLQRHAASESGPIIDESRRGLTEKRREPNHRQTGIGQGRVGSGRGLYTTPTTAAAST